MARISLFVKFDMLSPDSGRGRREGADVAGGELPEGSGDRIARFYSLDLSAPVPVLPLLVCGNAYSAYCEDPSEAFCGEETFYSSGNCNGADAA